MKKLSTAILANLIITNRKKLSMTQQSLADATGINRSLISRMEKEDFLPSIPQLEQLGEVLGFEPTDVFTNRDIILLTPDTVRKSTAATLLNQWQPFFVCSSLITHKLLLLLAKVVKHRKRLPLLKKRRVIRPHPDLKIDKVVIYCLLTVLSQIFN